MAVTLLEHHSNFIPWQQICLRKGWSFRVIPLDNGGQVDLTAADRMLDDSIGLLAVSHCSNVLGTVTPVEALCRLAHSPGHPGAGGRGPVCLPPAHRRVSIGL